LFLSALALLPCPARSAPVDDHLAQARRAWERRDTAQALELAGKAIAAAPGDVRGHLLRGTFREALSQHAEAVADFTACLALDPACAEALDRRGSELFKLGHLAEALADFDRSVKLRPEAAPGHWKRGIALYYAGRYDEGRRQFEGYEKVDTNDVENAVWHFLCVARKDGLEKARASILKIGKDRRVPMMQVYDLYRGALKPADVLAAAEAGDVAPPQRQQRLFYAHLYLGLYYDATGDRTRALEHITQAAGKYRIPHYMGDVARVHEAMLRKERKPTSG
jgi:lipoprotein NlpI